MNNRFDYVEFGECNLDDPFFASLKADYPEFTSWFQRKASASEKAYVHVDENGIHAFEYLKDECEEISLSDTTIPMKKRIKIGTLKIGDDLRGQRLGEGLIGIALWNWQASGYDEIYATVFPKHNTLIGLMDKFGFCRAGQNERGELIFLKSKLHLDTSDPYKMFPFLPGNFRYAKYIPIRATYHDTLFPYSMLARTKQTALNIAVANGISKMYIGTPQDTNLNYRPNTPILIYRISDAPNRRTYLSAVSSFGVVTNFHIIKQRGNELCSENDFIRIAGNKSFFSDAELRDIYRGNWNIVTIEVLYNGYFGEGNNVNHAWLKANGYFPAYPYKIDLPPEAFRHVLQKGGKDDESIIFHQP